MEAARRTKICPVQRLICQPHLEQSAFLLLIKLGHGETCAVHSDRVASVAIVKDGRGIGNGQGTSAVVA